MRQTNPTEETNRTTLIPNQMNYTKPEIKTIKLDREISLILQSTEEYPWSDPRSSEVRSEPDAENVFHT